MIFSYASTSIFNLDLNATVIFSSKMVIFSTSRLTGVSEYSVIASVCSSRKETRSLTLSRSPCLAAASERIACRSSRSDMIESPISSIRLWSLPTLSSSVWRCLISLSTSASCASVSPAMTALMFSFKMGRTESFLAQASLIAVTAAACRISSRIVRAGQSMPLLFFSTRLTHRQTVDLQPLLFHFILR